MPLHWKLQMARSTGIRASGSPQPSWLQTVAASTSPLAARRRLQTRWWQPWFHPSGPFPFYPRNTQTTAIVLRTRESIFTYCQSLKYSSDWNFKKLNTLHLFLMLLCVKSEPLKFFLWRYFSRSFAGKMRRCLFFNPPHLCCIFPALLVAFSSFTTGSVKQSMRLLFV